MIAKKTMSLPMLTGAVMLLFLVACQAAQKSEHMDISPSDFQAKIKAEKGLVLDVRTPKEVAEGTIEGAVVIDYFGETFKEELGKLDKGKPIYVYCRSGRRSGEAMAHLKSLGYPQVYNLEGGILAWQKAGYPMTAATKEP